jgi:GNAT superfamily N-acetyltransferase
MLAAPLDDENPGGMISEYPQELEHTVGLRSGAHVRIRPIRPADEPRLTALYDRLSVATAYQRFFSPMRSLPPAWAHAFANLDYRTRLALVAEPDDAAEGVLVGVARYAVLAGEARTAEMALVVEDGWQGVGLGTVLLAEILRAAEGRGIHGFRADVLAGNRRMLHLLARYTDVVWRNTHQGVTEVIFRRLSAGKETTRAQAGPDRA